MADDLPGTSENFFFFERLKRGIKVEIGRQSKGFSNVGLDELAGKGLGYHR
jgi:hypothetical protein